MYYGHARELSTGLGQISADEIAQANDQVTDLGLRMDRQFMILDRARGAGYDRALIDEAMAQWNQLFGQLQALEADIPHLDSGAFGEWIARVEGFEQQVAALEGAVGDVTGRGASARTVKIVVATVGAVAGASLLAYLWWAYTTPGSVLSKRGWRKRRRR